MSRNRSFHPSYQPFRAHTDLDLRHDRVTGPIAFFNPTRASYRHSVPSQKPSLASDTPEPLTGENESHDEQRASDVEFRWRSRDNRKGRHTLLVDSKPDATTTQYLTPKCTSTLREVCRGFLRMATQFPYWDISWLVAVMFTLGSCVWVINAFFVWLPLVDPSTEFKNEILTGGGVTAFVGATIFEVGSVLLMFEAVNENRGGCFGWALENVWSGNVGEEEIVKVRPDKDGCLHHHRNKKNLAGKSSVNPSLPSITIATKPKGTEDAEEERGWVWFPSWDQLKSHYLRELGFLASLSQFCGATIFWISGFTALPGINNKMSQGLLDGLYWTPQIVGGTGFIISGLLFMIESQERWYLPSWNTLGWHIGLWNLIGAWGFTLCGALGPAYGSSSAQYEASLATFWGSWAFLIGSVIQWYESLDKHPVEEIPESQVGAY